MEAFRIFSKKDDEWYRLLYYIIQLSFNLLYMIIICS
jgi:tryptophan-rich sensory protein